MSIREEFLKANKGNEAFAASAMVVGFATNDKATCKAGYSAETAIHVTKHFFPDVHDDILRTALKVAKDMGQDVNAS
jgi:hypothetical protein